MAPDSTPGKRGLSLYANLLDPSSSSTISGAPVTYNQPAEASSELDDASKKQQQALAASLRFQPTKRPQISAQKAKAKAIASKFSQLANANPSASVPPPPPPISDVDVAAPEPPSGPGSARPPKTTIADWTATASDDDNVFYSGEKRQRGGRKKRKKNNREAQEVIQNWDDIYDPSRPNNYEEYKNSEEKIREVREWKDLLYAHRMKRRDSSDYDSDRSERRPTNKQFALPKISFAPPSTLNANSPPPAPVDIPDDQRGEDAYARRMRMSQFQPPPPADPPPPLTDPVPPPPPPAGQISRAPVRYTLPPAPAEIPASEAELEAKFAAETPEETPEAAAESRSSRPGQAGFAARLLSKYGWTEGSGLGAQGTGIINPLYAKMDKRKKKPDAEGGGFATPAGTGKILGGDKSRQAKQADEGKFGAMSEVVKLDGMLKGMDLDEELTRGEGGGIMQEIGEECGDKYGSVERVYIHRDNSLSAGAEDDAGPTVFVSFVSQLSALRAVNALEGRAFGGNVITARFWAKDKFDDQVYE